MNQDEILAALREVVAANNQYTTWTVSTPHLVALVELAIIGSVRRVQKWLILMLDLIVNCQKTSEQGDKHEN